MLKFINENAVALPIIISLFSLMGTILGFFIKAIYELITKSKTKKENNVKALTSKIEQLKKDKAELTQQFKVEIKQLEEENSKLQKELGKYNDVVQSETGNYLTLKETGMAICPVCWSKEHLPIPIYENGIGSYECNNCKTFQTYSFAKLAENNRRIEQANDELSREYSWLNYNGD